MITDYFSIEHVDGVMVFKIESRRPSLVSIIHVDVAETIMPPMSKGAESVLEVVLGELIESFGNKIRKGLM